MRTGALARFTDSRNEDVSSRSCAGLSTLRLKRIRPQGCASRKKRRSQAVRLSPAHPQTKAETGIAKSLRGSVLRDEAVAALGLDLSAERVGLFTRQAADADAIDRL